MNGAGGLVKTLLASDVDVCFSNPGTSEMHFVAALDQNPAMRCVLCLFEGVATGAADGYARMAGKPAATLLHLGPGLGNGLANIHNAKRARTPMVNIVGDHATYHLQYDAPLTSDIAGIAGPVSHWVKSARRADEVAALGAEAVAVARSRPGRIATLILPADTAWEAGTAPAAAWPLPATPEVDGERVDNAARVLRGGEPCLLLIGDSALIDDGAHRSIGKIAAATGAELLAPVSNARIARGIGRLPLRRVPYPVDQALARLERFRHAILVGAEEPVAFFAYPHKPSRLLPDGCRVHTLAEPGEDAAAALASLVETLGAGNAAPPLQSGERRVLRPTADNTITPETLALTVAARLPENAVVVDESITAGRAFFDVIDAVPAHDWLQITGGAIGIGPPLAAGAALACPDRKVISLQADGSALYTPQALWTQAREGLDVTTVILSNRAYAILQGEMRNVGAAPGASARDMFELDRPPVDWVALAKGFGVEGETVTGLDGMEAALGRGLAVQGPYLVEVRL